MNLKNYLLTVESNDREKLAKACGTSVGVLRNIAYGFRRAGESLCINLERESGGAVTCEELRPDVDWAFLRGTRKTEAAA